MLLTPTDDTIQELNERIFARLTSVPLDPKAHEAAALALGVLGLRYSGGRSSDLRGILNQMTAHLGMALALQDDALGAEGGLARVILDLLLGRERPATATLIRVRADRIPEMPAWDRALWMRATNDWRRLEKPRRASLLERLEYFRALESTRGKDFAARQMTGATPEPVPDWGRLLMCGQSCLSLELASVEVESGVRAELLAAASIGKRLGRNDADWWQTAITEARGRRPISDELWRQLVERAVANALAGERARLGLLGDYGSIRSFDEQVPKQFARSVVLSTLPIVLQGLGGPVDWSPEFAPVCEAAAQEVARAPWRVATLQWSTLRRVCPGGLIPEVAPWFESWVPHGTLYDLENRLRSLSSLMVGVKIDWPTLATTSKYNFPLIRSMAGWTHQSGPDARDFEPYRYEFGYNAELLRDWRWTTLGSSQPMDALEPARLLCKLDRADCFELIDLLRAHNRPDEAFDTAVAAFKASGRTVIASHFGDWLLDEYVRRGKRAEAHALADRVSGTGSYNGLFTRARLAEREGDYTLAERLRGTIDERYGAQTQAELRVRRLARTPSASHAEIQKALTKLGNPDDDFGKVSDQWLGERSVVFRRDATTIDLRIGDRIVEVNGWKIESLRQARVALTFTDTPEARLTVVRPGSAAPGGTVTLAGRLDGMSYAPIR